MADGNLNQFVNLNPYDEQLEKLRQRQRMVDLLQQQAMQPLESQTAPGGYVVQTSPILGLAKLLQSYMAGKAQRGVDTELSDLQEKAAQENRTKEAAIESAERGISERMFAPQEIPHKSITLEPGQAESGAQIHKLASTFMTPSQVAAPDQIGAGMPPKSITLEPGQAESGAQNQKLAAAMLAAGKPISTDLEEVTPTAQYRYDPQGAMRMAMTPAGREAMKGNPALATMLANMVKPKTLELGAIDPSKFTAESIREAQTSGDIGRLKPISTETKAPTTVGGMQWDAKQNKFVPIPGFTQQASAIAAAGAAARQPTYDPATISALASRVIAGDKTAITGLGRSPAAMMAIQTEVTKQMKDAGASPTAIADSQRKLTVRQKTETNFTGGKESGTVQAMNTFVQHTNHLYELADALDRGDIPAINAAKIAWQNATGQAAPNNLSLVGQLVADELQKAALGTAGGIEERAALKERLTGAKSGAVIKSAIEQARGLVKGQVGSLRQKWIAGYGDPDEFDNRFMTPETQALFAQPKQTTNSAAGTTPNIQSILDKYKGKK